MLVVVFVALCLTVVFSGVCTGLKAFLLFVLRRNPKLTTIMTIKAALASRSLLATITMTLKSTELAIYVRDIPSSLQVV